MCLFCTGRSTRQEKWPEGVSHNPLPLVANRGPLLQAAEFGLKEKWSNQGICRF
uniref:Uncharacterized protein n=1 Tax=viral metagenome TaxID=1070528 RepID=A0A6C0B143_9ZZZZ